MYEDRPLSGNRVIPHYHGDAVRVLFVFGALLLIVAESVGAPLPLSDSGAVVSAALLVIAAGITNPRQAWIHFVNALIALMGVLLFGTDVIARYRAGGTLSGGFLFLEALALLSLIALYFTVRTVRGTLLRPGAQ